MNTSTGRELKNFLITFLAMLLTVIAFEIAVSSGFTLYLGRIFDKIRIRLGLMPEHVIKKLTGHISYSYVQVNIAAFVCISLIFSFVAFNLISKHGTKYSGTMYGMTMSLAVFVIGVVFTILSRDPMNMSVVIFGVATTFFLQTILAGILLKKKD